MASSTNSGHNLPPNPPTATLLIGGGTGGHFPVVITHHLLQQLLQHPLSRLLLHQQQQQLLPNILALVLQREFGDVVQLRTKQIVLQDVTAAAGTVEVAEHEV